MKKIIDGKRYDTETAEKLAAMEWDRQHPNSTYRSDRLDHERSVYRTRKGALFAYSYSEHGYGRHREHGATGAYVDRESQIIPFDDERDAVAWMEHEGFPASDIEAVAPGAIDDA